MTDVKEIRLKIDPEGTWLSQLADGVNRMTGAEKRIRSGRFVFPSSAGNGYAAVQKIEPGLTLSIVHFHNRHPFTLLFEPLHDHEALYYFRYDLTHPVFEGYDADMTIRQCLCKGETMHSLWLVMSKQWMKENLHLLAEPDGRAMEAMGKGMVSFTYADKEMRLCRIRQQLASLRSVASSLRNAAHKGVILELIAFSWSNIILQKRSKAYGNKIMSAGC